MVIIFFVVWLCFQCPPLLIDFKLTSWGMIALAFIIVDISDRVFK
jgi:hypothetical protein